MNTLYIILAIFAIFGFVGYVVSHYCFDDNDPDLDWTDNYTVDTRPYMVNGKCIHPEFARFTHVVESNITCETTVQKCALCSKHLTEPFTECT